MDLKILPDFVWQIYSYMDTGLYAIVIFIIIDALKDLKKKDWSQNFVFFGL